MSFVELLNKGPVVILVKPNAKKEELSWDASRKAFRVSVTAPPDDNKANRAIIKLLSKRAGKRVHIIRGLKSREKLISLKP